MRTICDGGVGVVYYLGTDDGDGMSDFNSTDLAVAIEALAVTIVNARDDLPYAMPEDKWDELFRTVGEDMFVAGRRGDTAGVVTCIAKAAALVPASLRSKSMSKRFTEVITNRDRG